MTRIGRLIAVGSVLTLAAMTDVVLAQSAPATGSFKGTYAGDASDGGSMPIRTSTQGTDAKEPAKPTTANPKTSHENTDTKSSLDAGTKGSKR